MSLILKLNKAIVLIFFVIFLGLGLFLVKDYGISWDESYERDLGVVTVNYVIKGDQSLLKFGDRERGPFFEMVLVLLEKGLHLTNNSRALYLMRHTVTFLFFYLGVIFFYKLCKKIFHSGQTALLGCLFLILSPRIFADAFYNSKDIPCLAAFIISTYTLINYLESKTFVNAFIHALSSAIFLDIRIVGIIIPIVSFFFTSIDIGMMSSTGANFKRAFRSFFTYCFFLIVFTILFWPFLWSSPLNNFIWAFLENAHIKWRCSFLLYLGHYIKATHLPWHYIPVWIAISTPLVYVITFCIGYVKTTILAGRNFLQFYRNNKGELIILLLISLPMLLAILFKPVNFDAWRHMFFIYPAFLVFSIIGLRALFGFVRGKQGSIFIQTIFLFLILFNLTTVVLFMIRDHPYQYVYFNSLAGRNMKEIKATFELDYWGLTFTKALEYIVTNDSDRYIKVFVDGRAYLGNGFDGVNTGMLKANDKKRLIFVNNVREAKYFLSDYRWHKEEYPFGKEYYSISLGGASIVVVYRGY